MSPRGSFVVQRRIYLLALLVVSHMAGRRSKCVHAFVPIHLSYGPDLSRGPSRCGPPARKLSPPRPLSWALVPASSILRQHVVPLPASSLSPPPPAAAMPSLVAITQGTEGKGDLLEAAGTFTLDWLNNVNYGAVFALSLFPYLIFLKNIWPEDYPIPKTMKWGFASLLIFVVSTIIGGIAAKLIYNDVLANVDYIHGVAESLLGVTNIVLAIAAFRALEAAKKDRNGERPSVWTENGDLDGPGREAVKLFRKGMRGCRCLVCHSTPPTVEPPLLSRGTNI
ncbi:Protein of unknown function DUF3593 [Nannochloropsis gaditana]|uniref:Uncharacterized protein n=1 Tax=Nannochloropsis gaditana TaxID=72520 RepID=W7TZH9_9STRA|nr:Protein of unknown function DUF3593 [Nannochloropsis gaditana]